MASNCVISRLNFKKLSCATLTSLAVWITNMIMNIITFTDCLHVVEGVWRCSVVRLMRVYWCVIHCPCLLLWDLQKQLWRCRLLLL